LRTCVAIFEATAVPGCHARAKLADITSLLYTAACRHGGKEVNQAINPVLGVRQRSDDVALRAERDSGSPRRHRGRPANANVTTTLRPEAANLTTSSNHSQFSTEGGFQAPISPEPSVSVDTTNRATATNMDEEPAVTGRLPHTPLYDSISINHLAHDSPRPDSMPDMLMHTLLEGGEFDLWNDNGAWNELLSAAGKEYSCGEF
jgi:hypothetical protein